MAALVSAPALADKAAASGTSTRSWTANGVSMSQRTTRMHGKVVDSERRATRRDGSVSITGKTWGATVRGLERVGKDGGKQERLVVKAADGSTRFVDSRTSPNGTERTTVHLPNGFVQRTVRWANGNVWSAQEAPAGARR